MTTKFDVVVRVRGRSYHLTEPRSYHVAAAWIKYFSRNFVRYELDLDACGYPIMWLMPHPGQDSE